MATKITLEQFETINNDLKVFENGYTNKKCPICNTSIRIEQNGSAHSLKCETENCLSLDFRGL